MTEDTPQSSKPDPNFDLSKRFVRVTKVRTDGLIEFEFAIGEPDLCVELILPSQAFREFCTAQSVVPAPTTDALAPPLVPPLDRSAAHHGPAR